MSKISWTEKTWNPVVGCTKCSPGCKNCYAERMAVRLARMEEARKPFKPKYSRVTINGGWAGNVYCDEKALEIPLHWRKPRRIFVCSMNDLFHRLVPGGMIGDIHEVVKKCPQHTFQILTKRPERALEYYSYSRHKKDLPLKNLWLGVSICVPDEKPKIDVLRNIPAAIKFVSFEPLLADMGELDLTGIHWVIIGGESGPGARPMHPDWARSIRDQCAAAGVPFFFKQWGAWEIANEENAVRNNYIVTPSRQGFLAPYNKKKFIDLNVDGSHYQDNPQPNSTAMACVGKKAAGNVLDGKKYEEYPK